MSALQRLPVRLRLTLVFAAVMAVVLGATGLLVYAGQRSALDDALDAGLRTRADDLAALVRRDATGLRDADARLADGGESFAQVLDARGRVLGTTPQTGGRPLLQPGEVARALERPTVLEHGPAGEVDSRSRLLATPAASGGRRVVVVVGASLEARDEALGSLQAQLLLGGPLALLLAAAAGYAVAALALRPVERMRARAEGISGVEAGARLPVPAADDEIRRLGLTLNAMLERVDATVRRERRFAADASHELRTPLALLRTELELALRRARPPAELEAALRSAAAEADRLARLADDLLVLARADEKGLALDVRPVDAGALLERVASRFAARAATERRTVAAAATSGLRLHGDALRLEQALGNLVDNALRHGAGAVRLAAAADADGTVELRVADEGPGFPEAFLPHAFERFARADEARTRGGSGLGLALVDAVARAHGGAATAGNRDGGGAEVTLVLPQPAAAAAPAAG